jgi:hypothetical protein
MIVVCSNNNLSSNTDKFIVKQSLPPENIFFCASAWDWGSVFLTSMTKPHHKQCGFFGGGWFCASQS